MRTRARSLLPAVVLACATPATAQSGRNGPGDATRASATPEEEVGSSLAHGWSFGVGETFEYAIGVGPVRAGKARLGIEGRVSVDGVSTYHIAMEVHADIPFFGVDDRWESWVATDPLRALRVEQRVEEGRNHRHERFSLDYAMGRLTGQTWDETTERFAPRPMAEDGRIDRPMLDDVGFLYLLRMLRLEPGRAYRFDSHFLARGNPVEFRVLGRESIRVPAGRFETIVVEPVLPGMGILAPGTNARVYLTDDARRLLVKVTTSTGFGTVALHLKRYETGTAAGVVTP